MKAEAQAPGVLTSLLAAAAGRVAALASSAARLRDEAERAPVPRPFAVALTASSVAVIAEVKKRSPSAGAIRPFADAVALAREYEDAGAAAISVLTEPERFGGSLDDLARIAAAVSVPVLRKDFIIDQVQLYEARAAGASAVLLIARALPGGKLAELAERAREIGLEPLIEIHTGSELAAALAAGPAVIGVNARDLETLAMDAGAADALLARIPDGVVRVAESGLRTRLDIERVAALGADAVLIGTALAGAADPGAALSQLLSVPLCPRAPVPRL